MNSFRQMATVGLNDGVFIWNRWLTEQGETVKLWWEGNTQCGASYWFWARSKSPLERLWRLRPSVSTFMEQSYPHRIGFADGCTRCMLYSVRAVLSVCCTRCMLYSVYAVLGVCCTRCMLYTMYAVLHVCSTLFMLYTVSAVLHVCCTLCMLYSMYAVLPVCWTPCMLYSVYAVLGVCCTQC